MLKLTDNPPIVGAAGTAKTALRQFTGVWWVAHTKSRCEKAFAWDLMRRNVSYFLPMVERVTFSGGRKRRGMEPLFPSYVFFCGSADDRTTALVTDRLCQVIEVRDQDRLVDELSDIQRALTDSVELVPHVGAVVGEMCRVKRGPLEGLQGIVLQSGQRMRLILQVSILGQSVALEIDADLLERAA
jgi:transcription antitermination factor NusG